MSYYFHKYYLKTLHVYNSIDLGLLYVRKLKLFQKDKLICLTNENNFFIYDILNFNLLYKENISINNENFEKIELIDYDKFIIYNDNIIVLFKYIENINTCLKLITKTILSQHFDDVYHSMNIIYINGNLIISAIKIYIYTIIKDKDIQLQNHLISNISPLNIFLLNSKILGIFSSLKKIEFWSINHYQKWIYTTNSLPIEFYPDKFASIINLKDNDHILIDSSNKIDNKIYLFSYINRTVIKMFNTSYTYGYCFSKNNTLFVIHKYKHICLFDVKKGKLFKINRLDFEFRANLIIKDDSETFIVGGKNEILFLKASAFKTIFMDVIYFLGILLFFLKIILNFEIGLMKDYKFLFAFAANYLYFRYYINIPNLIEIDVIKKKYYFGLIGILILLFISFKKN